MFIIDGIFVLAVLSGFAAIFSPKFRQMLRIHGSKILDGATSPIEKEEDMYQQLMDKLPKQRAAVQRVMANAATSRNELDTRNKTVETVANRFKQAQRLGASDAALNELGAQFTQAKLAVTEQEAVVEEAQKAADEARATLDVTVSAIKRFGQKVENDRSKAELAAALRVTAEARTTAAEITSSLSAVGKASTQVERELEEARALNQLSKGTSTDQELQRLDHEAAAAAGRAELEELFKR